MRNLIKELNDISDVFKAGNTDQGFIDLDNLIKEYPTRAEPLIIASQYLLEINQLEKAKIYITKAASINPNNIDTLKFAGFIYNCSGKHHDALDYFAKCISLGCKDSDLLLSQANSYIKIGKIPSAKLILDHLRSIKKITAKGLVDLGTCSQYMNQGIEEAIKYCMEAINMEPDQIDAQVKLGEYMSIIGESQASANCFLSISKKMIGVSYLKFSMIYSNYLLSINYLNDHNSDYIFKKHKDYSNLLGEVAIETKPNTITKNRKIKLGFVSADFNTHPIYFFLYPLLTELNIDSFEIHLFSNMHKSEDSATEKYRKLAHKWHDIMLLSDKSAHELILQSKIDILIDLSGHTGNNRLPLFALRSAPIQISWLGYPNTTGLKNMDYRIVDEITDPSPHYDKLATETLLRINPCFLCYSPYESIDSLDFNPKAKTDEIIFSCFNNLAKIHPELINTWSIILNNTPNSKLLIKSRFSQEKDTKLYILKKFFEHGIQQDNIKLINIYAKYNDHMNSFNNVDLSLDPFPYNGTSSTCESLFMGVPVITRKGNCHASRVSSSLLSCINHNELITNSTEEYITKCIDLACDINRLKILKCEIRNDILKSTLMDAKSFAEQFESLLYSII